MTETHTIPIVEIYGPVIQGEGVNAGRITTFIRVGGCDYRCVWCDSLYAVLPQHKDTWTKMRSSDIVSTALERSPLHGLVTLSGGNPALYDMGVVVRMLQHAGRTVSVETQGTKFKPWLQDVDLVTVSPKPPSSGMHCDMAQLDDMLDALDQGKSELKIVVANDADYWFARAVHQRHPQRRCTMQVMTLQPVPASFDALRDDMMRRYNELCDWVMIDGLTDVHVGVQMHAMAYGSERAR